MWEGYSLITAVRFWNKKRRCDAFNLLLHFSQKPWYTAYEVRAVQFRPFVYRIFFAMCRKFGVSWSKASEKQKAFIEEIT